jgi:hypothetical protein
VLKVYQRLRDPEHPVAMSILQSSLFWLRRAAGILSTYLPFSVAWTTDRTRNVCNDPGSRASRRCAVPESDNSRKHELECMRLAADCMQLVGDVHNPALQSLFLRMARVWSNLADQGPGADTQGERPFQDQESSQAELPGPRANFATAARRPRLANSG